LKSACVGVLSIIGGSSLYAHTSGAGFANSANKKEKVNMN